MHITPSRSLLAVLLVAFLSSCTTAYDAQGRPQTVVTPGGALLGAAAIGLLAFALADDDDDDCHRSRYSSSSYNRGSSGYRSSSSGGSRYSGGSGHRSYDNVSRSSPSRDWAQHSSSRHDSPGWNSDRDRSSSWRERHSSQQ